MFRLFFYHWPYFIMSHRFIICCQLITKPTYGSLLLNQGHPPLPPTDHSAYICICSIVLAFCLWLTFIYTSFYLQLLGHDSHFLIGTPVCMFHRLICFLIIEIIIGISIPTFAYTIQLIDILIYTGYYIFLLIYSLWIYPYVFVFIHIHLVIWHNFRFTFFIYFHCPYILYFYTFTQG